MMAWSVALAPAAMPQVAMPTTMVGTSPSPRRTRIFSKALSLIFSRSANDFILHASFLPFHFDDSKLQGSHPFQGTIGYTP